MVRRRETREQVTMSDDDLRFGDISGNGEGKNDIVDRLITVFKVIVVGYVILKSVEILLNVQIPLL